MADELDDLIREIQKTSELSAAARNALHGCLSTHPWGRSKSLNQRIAEARFAIAGRKVSANLAHRLESQERRTTGIDLGRPLDAEMVGEGYRSRPEYGD